MRKSLICSVALGYVFFFLPVWAIGPYTIEENRVIDQATSLVWQTVPTEGQNWQEALSTCEKLTLDGYSDWRLPDIRELISIIDLTRFDPTIDAVFEYPGAKGILFWSSTTSAIYREARMIDFQRGNHNRRNKIAYKDSSGPFNSRCVRGGSGQVLQSKPFQWSSTLATVVSGQGKGTGAGSGGDTGGPVDGDDTGGTGDGGDSGGPVDGGDAGGTDDGSDTGGTNDGEDSGGTDDGGDTGGAEGGGGGGDGGGEGGNL